MRDWVVERRLEPAVRSEESCPRVPPHFESKDIALRHPTPQRDNIVSPVFVLVEAIQAAGGVLVVAREDAVAIGVIEDCVHSVMDESNDLLALEGSAHTISVMERKGGAVVEDFVRAA
jgi:hypothetical protein